MCVNKKFPARAQRRQCFDLKSLSLRPLRLCGEVFFLAFAMQFFSHIKRLFRRAK